MNFSASETCKYNDDDDDDDDDVTVALQWVKMTSTLSIRPGLFQFIGPSIEGKTIGIFLPSKIMMHSNHRAPQEMCW